MSGNEELMKAFSMFGQSLKELSIQKASNDAREEVASIRQQFMNKEIDEKQAELYGQDVGKNLALRLTGVASPDQIQAATQGLVPSANATATNRAQGEMQQAGFAQQTKEKQMDRDLALELQQMKNDALGIKDAKKETKMYSTFADKFRKENKDILDSRDKVGALSDLLEKTPDRVGVEMAKTGLLKFAGEDRVSDADVIRAQTDPSWRAEIARRFKVEMTGEALKDDRKFYKMILSEASKTMDRNLKKKVKGYAAGTAELAEIDGSKLESGLRKQLNLADDEPAARTLKSKLYSPKANKTKLIYSDGTEEVVDGKR